VSKLKHFHEKRGLSIRLRFAMIRAFDRVKLVAKVVTLNLKADKQKKVHALGQQSAVVCCASAMAWIEWCFFFLEMPGIMHAFWRGKASSIIPHAHI